PKTRGLPLFRYTSPLALGPAGKFGWPAGVVCSTQSAIFRFNSRGGIERRDRSPHSKTYPDLFGERHQKRAKQTTYGTLA
ncbi:MAG: hypothetical protein KDA89_25020, partial [Planctomycetaceae bacterium]|nr:hypothetical protein [Planctomycetaceae bacterium]